MGNDLFARVGKITDSAPVTTIEFEFRLAQWRTVDAYRRRYVEVLPSDRFIPGQSNEFVADLDFREWAISDWTGGQRRGNRWDPEDGAVSRAQSWYIGERNFPRVGPDIELTQDDAAANFGEGRNLSIMFGDLWARDNGDVVKWDESAGNWDVSAGISTGSASRGMKFVAVGDDVYLPLNDGNVLKITDFLGTPSVTTHVSSGTWSVAGGINPLASFDGRLFGLNGNDLYEVDLSTINTLTQVADVGGGTNWRDQDNIDGGGSTNERLLSYALSTSDKGPIWWVVNDDDGRIDIWEYNVAADTSTRIGRLPSTGGNPHCIRFGFGFVFVSFFDVRRRGYIWYKRAGIEDVIGPIPDKTGGPKQIRGDEIIDIAGFMGTDMVIVHKGEIITYDLKFGAFSHLGSTSQAHDPVGANYTSNSIVYKSDVFVGGVNTNKVDRTTFAEINQTDTTSDPILETGRWHFGYPSTYKTVAEVNVEIGHTGATGADQITVRGRMDNAAAWTDIGTVEDTEMGAPKTFSTNLRGYEMELQFELTGAASGHSFGDYIDLESVRARALTVEARREWLIVIDASNVTSAGKQLSDAALYSLLDDLKESGAIVSFENPFDNLMATAPTTYSRCRVAEVDMPPITGSPDDQREIVMRVREVDVIGRGNVT